MGRSSLFTRSKMIRYVKVMEKFAYATIVFGTVGYYFIAKDQEKIEKDSFLSQYTDKYSNQTATNTNTNTNTNTTTTTTTTTTSEPNKTI